MLEVLKGRKRAMSAGLASLDDSSVEFIGGQAVQFAYVDSSETSRGLICMSGISEGSCPRPWGMAACGAWTGGNVSGYSIVTLEEPMYAASSGRWPRAPASGRM